MCEILGCTPPNMYYILKKLTLAGFIENAGNFVKPTQEVYDNLSKVEESDNFRKFEFDD